MFCRKCGAKNENNAKFCRSCGNPLQDVAVSAPREFKATTPSAPAQAPAPAAFTTASGGAANRSAFIKIIASVVFVSLILLLAVIGIYYAVNRQPATVDLAPLAQEAPPSEEAREAEFTDTEEFDSAADPDTITESEPELTEAAPPVTKPAKPASSKAARKPAKPQKAASPAATPQPPDDSHSVATNPSADQTVAAPAVTYELHFTGLFGLIDEKRSYPSAEMRQKAKALWDKERKILEPDGSINEQYAQKQNSGNVIPGH